jgi:hypothetical protein
MTAASSSCLTTLYILSYLFAVLTLAVIVRNSWVDAKGDVAGAVRADRRGLAFLSASYAVAASIILVVSARLIARSSIRRTSRHRSGRSLRT